MNDQFHNPNTPDHIMLGQTQLWEAIEDVDFKGRMHGIDIVITKNPDYGGRRIYECEWADVANWIAQFSDGPGRDLNVKKPMFRRAKDLEEMRQDAAVLAVIARHPKIIRKLLALSENVEPPKDVPLTRDAMITEIEAQRRVHPPKNGEEQGS